jgi:hypothetical protein
MYGFVNGLKIVESIHLTVPYEDWSEVRSPSRAIRRMRQGHRQRVRYLQVPDPNAYRIGDTVHMHPETARQLRRMIAEQRP